MEQLVLSCLESRVEDNRSIYGRFLLGAFKNGDALTVATALRRALLSQVQSVAIIALDIQGVSHEFSTIVGARESVLELTLNFQQIILRTDVHLKSPQVGYLQIQGPAVVYANDLKLPKGVECVNPSQYLATLTRDGLLIVKFLISSSGQSKHLKINNQQITSQYLRQVKGVLSDKQFRSQICLQNILPLDSSLSPVNRVNFTVEKDDIFNQTRERVLLEIWTNGSLHPREALNQAVFSLVAIFSAFRNVIHLDSHSLGIRKSLSSLPQIAVNKRLSVLYKTNLEKMSLLSSDISNLSFSLKTYIFLKQKGINKLEHLLQYSPKRLLELVNGNKKIFYDIKRCLLSLGLQLQ
uniref:RNA polymerase alpha subunit n=1 Tax=Calidiella yingdensis TaxID=3031288 RepID=UPI002410DE64|nr:RNA polymerase alpha subunit [Calidiella yingdensis]WDY13050.1 RNA polymerase alpha subunit [Calidiella yingdensis]